MSRHHLLPPLVLGERFRSSLGVIACAGAGRAAAPAREPQPIASARGLLFAVDFAPQLGDVAFLVDEARGGTVGCEVEFAVGFPASDKAEREFAAFDGREIKLLVILLLIAIGVAFREQEGTGTQLYILARAGFEDLHAAGGCLLVRAVLVVGQCGLAYDLLDVFELERGSRMGVSGKADQSAEHDGESFHIFCQSLMKVTTSAVQ